MHDLSEVNQELLPLKALADRELASIYGLTGKVYTPHIDEYMQASIQKAEILACLKKQGLLAITEVEVISSALDFLHKRAKNNAIVDYNGHCYKRCFAPLKLSKSGKVVRIWAKYWLLQLSNGRVDPKWESQVREVWPTYFLIKSVDI